MLTLRPMLVQYLTGLCCLRANPEAVDITLGDMVMDTSAEKTRDVDVTVSLTDEHGVTYAFMAYEVKREAVPLDVAAVEQLCLKLNDMPSITHRAVVSVSGYTEAAQKKAANHGVELYEFKPWTKPIQEQFPELEMEGLPEECIASSKILLCWVNCTLTLGAPESQTTFSISPEDKMFNAEGKQHNKYQTFSSYREEILLRSTEILYKLEPAISVLNIFPIPLSSTDGIAPTGPAWPHTHSLDVSRDAVYIKVADHICRLDTVTINGHLRWQRGDPPLYYVLENVSTGKAFSAALISEDIRDGNMTALVFSPQKKAIGIHFVRLAEKHLNCIRDLKVKLPG